MNLNRPLFLTVVLLFIGITCVEIQAETRYVSEQFEITMRTGPGADRKIIALIRSGSAVTIEEPGEEWTMIRHNDKAGWVLTRYLSTREPCAMTLAGLKESYGTLKKENDDLRRKNTDLEADKNRLQNALATHQENLEKISSEYEKLKQESADFLKLKADCESMSKQLSTTKAKAEKIEAENKQLLKSQSIKWFSAGAGVFILGIFFGFLSRRPRRQSSLLG